MGALTRIPLVETLNIKAKKESFDSLQGLLCATPLSSLPAPQIARINLKNVSQLFLGESKAQRPVFNLSVRDRIGAEGNMAEEIDDTGMSRRSGTVRFVSQYIMQHSVTPICSATC